MNRPEGSLEGTVPPTFDALCRRHGELLEAQAEDELDTGAAKVFVEEAAAAGVQIESVSERDAIRSMINYWTGSLARMATASGTSMEAVEPVAGIDRQTLASFDASQSPDLDESKNPFVGLAAFDVGQSDVFFGRDHVVADLLETVLAHPLVVVSGASGTGKSSLVRAGLTGAIQARAEGAAWVVALASPGRDPIASLVAALAPQAAGASGSIESWRTRLDSNPAEAGALAAERMGEASLLVIIDQLEELFSLCPAEERDRAAAAISAIAALPRAHVVVTIRDEYLEGERSQRALSSLDLTSAEEFRIPPLDSNEIRAAIAEPAARAGLVFQDGLVDRIVAEVGTDPAALPLLQYSLLQMWRERQGNRVTLAVYEKVGGPATALSNAAQRIYDGFVQQTRENTKIIFQQLIRPSLVYEFVRDRVSRGELERLLPGDSIKTVINPFVDAGLMHVSAGTARTEDRIEIAHEALIRNWELLRRWASEVRDRERLFLEIDAQAKRWEDSGRVAGHLLFGKALQNAEAAHKQYLARARVDPVANARVQTYLSTSRTQQRRMFSLLIVAAVAALLLIGAIGALYFLRNRSESARLSLQEESESLSIRLQSEGSDPDEDVGRQFIQMLLTRGDIDHSILPPQFAEMTSAATSLSLRGSNRSFDANFLGLSADILPAVTGTQTELLKLPNLRVFYDPQFGSARLVISQSDRSARSSLKRTNALYSWPGLPGQIDEQLVSQRGLVLARLVDPREVAWGSQGDEAASAVNLLALMFPVRQRGPDPAQLNTWSTLSASMRTRHNPAAQRVMYFSGVVPSTRGEAPRMLWKIAVSRNGSGGLVADAFTLPARTSLVAGTLDIISARSGVDFSRLKDALGNSPTPGPKPQQEAQTPNSSPASLSTLYIQVQGIAHEQASALRSTLAEQGLQVPPIQRVNACVSPSQLRYYYPQDAAAAGTTAKMAETALGDAGIDDGTVRLVQLSLKAFPNARPGNLELWLCNNGGKTAR